MPPEGILTPLFVKRRLKKKKKNLKQNETVAHWTTIIIYATIWGECPMGKQMSGADIFLKCTDTWGDSVYSRNRRHVGVVHCVAAV